MPKLHNIQENFLSLLYGDAKIAADAAAIAANFYDRLTIYQNNLQLTAAGLLRDIYPITHQLLGDDFIRIRVPQFLRLHPFTSGDRHQWGGQLANFLGALPELQDYVFVPPMAALEWALYRAQLADDGAVVDFATLAAKLAAAEDVGCAPHASVQMIAVGGNILPIWQAHRADYPLPSWQPSPAKLLVWRNPADELCVQQLTPDAENFLKLLAADNRLDNALDQLGLPLSAAQQLLAAMIHHGVLIWKSC